VEYLSDLYSKQQAGQEFQTFSSFDPNNQSERLRKFIVAFGTSFVWEVSGGSNFWREFKDEYESEWSIQSV
jgi:hypothetical protein